MSCELKDMKYCRWWLAFKKSLSKHLQENLQKPLCEFQTRSLITSADFLKSQLGRVEEYTILFVVQLEKLECSDMRLKIAILKFGFFFYSMLNCHKTSRFHTFEFFFSVFYANFDNEPPAPLREAGEKGRKNLKNEEFWWCS